MDSEKRQRSPPETFFSLSNNLDYLQKIEKESKGGREEFTRISEDENKRVQQVVEKENQRIMQEMRKDGTIKICPLCLEEIPAIKSHEELKRERSGMILMMCCGVTHCNSCTNKSLDFMYGKSRNDPTNAKCYNCREPIRNGTYWASTVKHNDQRHWILHALAIDYMEGTNGFKKNIKKGIKLFERAADLGNADAQSELAAMYFNGNLGYANCLDKARHYAEKAANQGAPIAQHILGFILLLHDKHYEEYFRLLTLAAFQGIANSQCELGIIYESRYQSMITRGDEAWRKHLLLSLYWYGKGTEAMLQSKENRYKISLAGMAFQLDVAMSLLWHPRDHSNIDPIPGYSHVPFYTWALAKGGQHPGKFLLKDPRLLHNHAWKNVCANCGNKSQEKQEFKACARCRAFHYCSKKCQVKHWKNGHNVDCKGHWIEEYFPEIRNVQNKF